MVSLKGIPCCSSLPLIIWYKSSKNALCTCFSPNIFLSSFETSCHWFCVLPIIAVVG